MSARVSQAADVRAPRRGEVYRYALTASSVRYTLPDEFKGNYVTMASEGTAFQVQFGDSSVSVTADAVASGAPTMTVNNASGETVAADTKADFRILDGDTDFAVVGAAASGFFTIRLSNNRTR